MIPSDNQIAKEQRRFPGLGKLQAIRAVQARHFLKEQQRTSVFAPRIADEPQFATVEAYWRDPTPFDAEAAEHRAEANAHFDAHRDAALAKLGYI